MTDQSLRRADQLLSDLVEQVETARALPMSSSCVLPRERVLDLLDELREVLPVEIDQARRMIAARDTLLHDAHARAEATATEASGRAASVLHAAELHAREIRDGARAEQDMLVSATTVHQQAQRAADELRARAEADAAGLRARAEQHHRESVTAAELYASDVRGGADHYAAKLSADSEAYADRALRELGATLQRALATAEQGRAALAERRAAHTATLAEATTQATEATQATQATQATEPTQLDADSTDTFPPPDDRLEAEPGAQERISA